MIELFTTMPDEAEEAEHRQDGQVDAQDPVAEDRARQPEAGWPDMTTSGQLVVTRTTTPGSR
jgi:hypothetical protein